MSNICIEYMCSIIYEGATMFEIIGTLLMLVFLQIVLGFDNLLYISIESKRVEESQQKRVRQIGVVFIQRRHCVKDGFA